MMTESRVYRLFQFSINYALGICSSLYIFTIGVFSAANRSFIRTIVAHCGLLYKPATVIPEVGLSQIVPNPSPIYLVETDVQDGNVSLLETVAMNQMIRMRNPQGLFEMGTFDGRTTLNMSWNASETAKIYTIDLPKEGLKDTGLPIADGDKTYIDKDASGVRYRGTSVEKKITQLYGDTAKFDFSPYYNSMDLVFIDAAHSYDYVLSDTRQGLKLLRDGRGLVLWHDYDAWDGVTKALNELFLNDPNFRMLRRIKGTNLVFLAVGETDPS